jgi:putative salt-induced outer membrane protein YdiY
MFRPLLLALISLPALALAEEAAPAAQPQAASATELSAAVKAAKDAAESARVAAEAARTMAEALKALGARPAEPAAPAPPAAPAEEKKDEKKPAPWAYQVGLNLISITGNATNVALKLGVKVDGKWGDWALAIKSGAAYGQATVGGTDTTVTAKNADAMVRGDRTFGKSFVTFVQTGALADHVASISYQAFGESGVGVKWWELTEGDFLKSKLTTDFGLRFTREEQYRFFAKTDAPVGYIKDNNILALRASLALKYAITRTSVFSQDFEILPDVRDTSNLRWTSNTALSAQIDKGFALQLGFKARYIGQPAAGAKNLDTELGGGVTFAF